MNYKNIFLSISLLILFSCKKENLCDCVKTTGTTTTTIRNTVNFNCIELNDKMDLYLSQSPVFEVKVEAGKHLQSLIKMEIDGETLKVVNSNKCNWVRGYKHKINVYVKAPFFKSIINKGLGAIQNSDTITQDEIFLKTANSGEIRLLLHANSVYTSSVGNGDIYLYGKTQKLISTNTSTSFLYASGLTISNYVNIHSVSVGHAYINAPENELMDVAIDKSGNIYYKGTPNKINLSVKGKGELIKQ